MLCMDVTLSSETLPLLPRLYPPSSLVAKAWAMPLVPWAQVLAQKRQLCHEFRTFQVDSRRRRMTGHHQAGCLNSVSLALKSWQVPGDSPHWKHEEADSSEGLSSCSNLGDELPQRMKVKLARPRSFPFPMS